MEGAHARKREADVIGVFDSGFGGLTILRALARLPERLDFVYFGDNARAPYGTRPGSEIVELTRQGLEILFQRGCGLAIVACNTASVVALREVQRNWLPSRPGPRVNVLGIVVPTIEQVTGVPWSKKTARSGPRDSHDIAVFATLRTVESQVYPIEIAKRRPDIEVHQEACPGLATAIETGADPAELGAMIERHVRALVDRTGRLPRKVILGCTHYSLVGPLFARALGPEVEIVDQPAAVAASLGSYLGRHSEYRDAAPRGEIRFLTSGFSPKSLAQAAAFWGSGLEFETITLP